MSSIQVLSPSPFLSPSLSNAQGGGSALGQNPPPSQSQLAAIIAFSLSLSLSTSLQSAKSIRIPTIHPSIRVHYTYRELPSHTNVRKKAHPRCSSPSASNLMCVCRLRPLDMHDNG